LVSANYCGFFPGFGDLHLTLHPRKKSAIVHQGIICNRDFYPNFAVPGFSSFGLNGRIRIVSAIALFDYL
jgi:hypothetical protein